MRFDLFATTLLTASLVSTAQAQLSSTTPAPVKGAPAAKILPPVTPGTPIAPVAVGSFLVGGSDNCATADVISGNGSFAVNTTAATSGAPIASCGGMGNDVWFRWTPTTSGVGTVSTCGGVASDSVIGIWADNGGGCPTTQILCLDDSCGLQTSVNFSVTAGTPVMIELGGYFGQVYSGTFTTNVVPAATNDSCSLPVVLVGAGPYNFNTTSASTGTEGQTEALCLAFGTTNIYNDVWFTWTAPSTGQFELSLCAGGAAYDTRAAVYPGAGCPAAGSAIACNDDSCGLVSALCFSATSGATYSIQIGAYGTTGSGTGTFSVTAATSGPGGCTAVDDGSSENSVGLTAGGAMIALVGFGSIGSSTSISSIEMAYGTPGFPGGYIPQGPVTVCVWEDPNDDANPSDAVLLYSGTATVAPGSIDTDVLQNVAVAGSVVANGFFWIGYTVNHNAGEFPCSLDQSSGGGSACGGGGAGGSWVAGSTTGIPSLTNLLANDVPVQSMSSVGIPGNWLIRVNCGSGSAGTPYCFGDGTGVACPCGNSGTAGHGCNNSFATGGALLAASGSASVSADTIQLQSTGLPPLTTGLNFQGTAPLGVAFGDGLRCAGGTVTRLGIRTIAGALNFGFGVVGDPLVSVAGGVPAAGGTRYYQLWYRNIAPFCSPSGFNLSNGLSLVWAP